MAVRGIDTERGEQALAIKEELGAGRPGGGEEADPEGQVWG